jgi:signal transduction histidine kinase
VQLSAPESFLLAAFLVNLGFGLLVLMKPGSYKRIRLSFSVLAWSGAGWALSFFMVYLLKDDPLRLFWGRMGFATSGIIPSAFFTFAFLFPREQRGINLTKTITFGLPALLFLVLSFTDQIVSSLGVSSKMFNYGPLYPFFSIYLTSFIILGFLFLIKTYRRTVGIERLQVKYCLLGMFFTAGPALTNNLFLPMAGISSFNWLGPPFTMIMLGFTAYSIVRHRLMDINIVFTKGTTYIFLLLLLFIPLLLISILSQKVFFGKISYLHSFIIFSLLFIAALLFGRIKPRTEKAVEQIFFKDRYDYRETLSKFSKAMVSILDLGSLSKRIIETITQTMGVDKASFFLVSEENGGFNLCESKNVKITTSTRHLPKDDPLPYYLQKVGEIIIREEMAKRAHIPVINNVVNEMSLLEAEVSIPLIWKEQLIGMINLSHKFTKDIYSREDVELLSTLANQTAIAIENARLYEDLKRSKSYIRRADRLASLGTLTAGLAHEIRNPLVAIKTLTHLLPERIDDEEFREKFLQIASGEVDRISSLVTELLDFARPADPKLEMENIGIILDGMILLVSTEANKKQINMIKNYASDLPFVQIDREQIKQVFLNILLNAIEATPEKGEITVRTRSFMKPGGEPYVQIEFTDTGCGIPSDQLEEIFNPFFTTKNTGSGLGLSISNQIVRDHRGYVDVESQLGKGSSFFINLPVNQDHPKRRKDDSENNQKPSDIFKER